MAKTIEQRYLTMLTASEVAQLSSAALQDITTTEDLVYKYRDEFLYIQRLAEQGLKTANILVDNPRELGEVAQSWGFTVTLENRSTTRVQYRTNLGQQETTQQISNVTIDWNKPGTPTVDVAYYRESGNLVSLLDSTLFVPRLEKVKKQLNIVSTDYTIDKSLLGKNFGL
jgi:hypothetical protein